MKILMVCLGNICRSPLAEGIMSDKVRKIGLDWEVDSAGTGAWHVGEQPDQRSIRVAGKYGIDISRQRARQFKPHDLDRFDLVLAMDSSNHRDILRHASHVSHREKVRLIMDFVSGHPASNVPDPYWDDNGFESVFFMLDQACEAVIHHFHTQG
ncbi:MAG: hypothetical protein RLY31_671 [Bacteroidota bacterium]|jgi:protein-tyrosine phosphatase